ncbi:hypothetical protein, partial [Actinomadura sp. KC345]|uniref:hypothetical protein n=1 Tax=Actinomadura sp. KC345 TaxID=2530371 RepID=UPI001A9E24EB
GWGAAAGYAYVHLARFGAAPDGRVFFDTAAGADFAPITNTMYGQLWQSPTRCTGSSGSERGPWR